MAQSRRMCLGGPWDGRAAAPVREQFAYLDRFGRAYRKPGVGRALYRQEEGRWQYAGEGSYICRCGAVVDGRAGGRCPLCGAGEPRGGR